MMRLGSLFSGVGGFEIAFRDIAEPVYFAEKDKHCRWVLNGRFPETTIFEDANDAAKISFSVDIITGGFPCQPHSLAGRRGGSDDERDGGDIIVKAVENQRPEWFLFENVPDIVSTEEKGRKGEYFRRLIKSFTDIGYGVCWRVLNAQYFGVPQRRRRIFIVGRLGNLRSPAKVLFEPEGLLGNRKKGKKKREEAAGEVRNGAGNGSGPTRALTARHDSSEDGTGRGVPLIPTAAPLTAGSTAWANNPGRRREDDENLVADQLFSLQSFGDYQESETASTLKQRDYKDATDLICYDPNQVTSPQNRSQPYPGNVSPTLSISRPPEIAAYTLHGSDKTVSTASETDKIGAVRTKAPGSMENSSTTVALDKTGVRRLTPLECERLQGFSDNFTAGQSDSQRYKQMGNAVAVPVVRWIAERIQKENSGQ